MSNLYIVAHFKSRPEHQGEVESLLQGFVEPSRRDDGCLCYDLHRDTEDHNSFAIVDGWRDRAAVDNHVGAAHVAATIAKLEPLLAEPPVVRVYQRINP